MWIFNIVKQDLTTNVIWMVKKMNMHMLTIYIIHCPFGDVMLSHDFQLDVKCDFTYATKII